jgi:hypothetical protein
MDWHRSIDRNRMALLAVVAALFARLGLGGSGGEVGPSLRLAVLRILRPAEAAVRRLIFVASRKLEVKLRDVRPFPAGGIARGKGSFVRPRRPLFVLTDRLVPMAGFGSLGDKGPGPRIRTVVPLDPTVAGYLTFRSAIMAHQTSPAEHDEDHVNAVSLVRRLEAIRSALDDIAAQAKRLQRWTARRLQLAQTQSVHTVPLKPGRPPGFRSGFGSGFQQQPTHEIDHILHDCHVLAHEVRLNSS